MAAKAKQAFRLLRTDGFASFSRTTVRYLRDSAAVTSTAYHGSRRQFHDLRRRLGGIAHQRARIAELLDQESFVLIVLDACRYDYFEQEYGQYLSGDLEKTWSAGDRTPMWLTGTWPDEYDLTYLSANSVVSDLKFEMSDSEYRPSEHFDDIVHVWETEWDPAMGTVPPEDMTDAALSILRGQEHPRMVVHYLQPHFPCVHHYLHWQKIERSAPEGVDRETFLENTTEITLEDVKQFDIGVGEQREYELEPASKSIDQQAQDGELSDPELQRAYRRNLQEVLEAVKRLITHLDVPTVVTADHGEGLGDGGLYGHPKVTHPVLRTVPWLRVHEESLTDEPIPDDVDFERSREERATSGELKQQLRDLGYR